MFKLPPARPSVRRSVPFARQLIALLLTYALLLQFIPQFSRVAHARTSAFPAEGLRGSNIDPARYKSELDTELASMLSPQPPVAETITDAVISRHKPTLNNGRIEGSLRVLLGESFTIPNATLITSDVYLPGAPSVQVNNGAQHGGIVEDGGANTPTNYTLTLANNATLAGRIHTHADAIELPAIATSVPPAAGTRTVNVNSQSQVASIGNWQTVRDLNVNGSHITVDMPPGNYGTLTVNGNSQVNLSAGTYNFANTFNLDGSAKLQATGAVVIGGHTINYTYDELYRLKSETIANDPHGVNGLVSYDYDPVGNRLSRTSTVTGVPSQSSTFDANDRLSSDTYDANGNTTASTGNSFDYDFENHLTSLNNGSVTYVYDGDGNRVAKTVGGVTTNYLVDTNNHTGYAQVVEELQSGAVVKSFTFGQDLISQRNVGGPLSFYSYDGHGSVRQLTDATSSITDTYDYDAFGILISRTGTTPNDYLYSGEQFDENLGFYYLRARYMNSMNGRFLTADSFEGVQFDPITLHKYLYSNADPVMRIDPSGHYSIQELAQVAMFITVLASITVLVSSKTLSEVTITMTLRPNIPRPSPKPSPLPAPYIPPLPTPSPTPDDDSNRFVNFDTSTVEAITMEGSTEAENIFAAKGNRQIMMCVTALAETQYRVDRFAGIKERRRVDMLRHLLTPILDLPDPAVARVPDPNGTRVNDKIIFGTGQSLRIQTFTADRTFVEHARSNGVVWTPYPYIHGPGRFTGQ